MAREGHFTEDEVDSILSRITVSTSITTCANADFIVECILEDLGAKQQLLRDVTMVCTRDTVIACTTMTLSVTDIAAHCTVCAPRKCRSQAARRTREDELPVLNYTPCILR